MPAVRIIASGRERSTPILVMRTPEARRIRADLESQDARTRERGVAALPKGSASIRAIRRLVAGSDGFVRNAALERLLEWDAADALPIVLSRLRDPFDIARITALECVAYWGTDAHRRQVIPLLTDSSPTVRAYAGWALGELGSKNLLSKLQRRLRSERHPIPRALHEVLFRLRDDERHLKALVRALSAVNHRAACFAARSLGNCVTVGSRARIVAALRHAVRSDRRLGVRETAAKALQGIEQAGPHNMPLQPSSRKRSRAKKALADMAARG